MSYRIVITSTAVKERNRLSTKDRQRVDTALKSLVDAARPLGARKLSGSKNDWRIRVGDYRILYEIDDDDQVVTIWRIAHRREAYR
jgi:mRNA interferase RelE/StbE